MRIIEEPASPLAYAFGFDKEKIRVAHLSKAELVTLDRAATILETLREQWGGDDNHSLDTDVALAAYTMRDLIEGGGQVEV